MLLALAGFSSVDAFSAPAATTMTIERANLMESLPKSGFICHSPAEVQRVCDACESLEAKTAEEKEENVSLLDGNWILRFTSASPYGLLARSSLPGDASQVLDNLPEAVRKFLIDDSVLLPQSIEQRIENGRLINCVDLAPWPKSGNPNNPIADSLQQGLSSVPGPLGDAIESLKEAKIHLELDHSFTVQSDGTTLDLSLEVVRRTLESSGPDLPSFIPKESTYNMPEQLKSTLTGSFTTTYVDKTVRIARGTSWPFNDELLVFERIGVPDMEIPDGCELSWDGETPVILCEDDGTLADSIPSD